MRAEIFDEIHVERMRQDAKWGEQNHKSVATAYPGRYYGVSSESSAKARCEWAAKNSCLTWGDIACEEMAEALNSDNDTDRREELVQLAAVVVAWIECLDRNRSK